MDYSHHVIHNFPENYPWWKKAFANILFFIGGMVIHDRKNLLNNWDFIRSTHTLRKGDVVLVGSLRRLSSYVIEGPVTHGLLYIGKRRFIHAIGDGVEYVSLHDFFCEYDTMVILRSKKANREEISRIIECAKKQVGKPYDYEFTRDAEKFYCTELIEYVYEKAGCSCGVKKEKICTPVDFINDTFKIKFLSHNLRRNGEKVELRIK